MNNSARACCAHGYGFCSFLPARTYRACKQSLLEFAAWRQNPVFLPYPDGGHGDQARRDWVCWRQLQLQGHSATMKAALRAVHVAHRTRPQHAVGKHYGMSAHSCRGALTKHGGRVVAYAIRSSQRNASELPMSCYTSRCIDTGGPFASV